MNAITQDFITGLVDDSDLYWTYMDFFDGAEFWHNIEDEVDFACQELYGMNANQAGVNLTLVTDYMRKEYETQRSSHCYDEEPDNLADDCITKYYEDRRPPAPTIDLTTPFNPKEPATMAIEDVTLINGVRADNMSDEQLFDLIRQEKAAAKNLEDLPSDSKAVQKRKADIAANIARLVKLVDERQEDSAE